MRREIEIEQPKKEKKKTWSDQFWDRIVASLTTLPIVMWLWPGVVPFGFFETWNVRGTPSDWFAACWPLLLWPVVLNGVIAFSSRNNKRANLAAEQLFALGAAQSLLAGVLEEITCRWLFFYLGIIGATFSNFLFFGWAGFGIAEFLYLNIFGPLANWLTFGSLSSVLFHGTGWAVGASLLATNAFFRDGHKYQGLFGMINSWCVGMYMFWIMIHFGLPVAILMHFSYDILIDCTWYLDRSLERALLD